MALVDFILNITGLLLWLNWRSARFNPLVKATPATLVGTLKRAAPRRLKGWPYLAALAALLLVRALVYRQIGSAADWTPKLDLGLIVLPFRNDLLRSVLLFSLLSYARILLLFYVWILSLNILNRQTVDSDPIQKLIRMHLGRIGRWPWPVQGGLPLVCISVFWVALHPLLLRLGLTSPVSSEARLVAQGLLVAAGAYLSLKLLLPVFLLLYLIVSYVYLGTSALWDFIGATARGLLAPLRGLPLRFGKLDLAPLVGVLLILVLLHILPNYILRKLDQAGLTIWPR